VQSKPVFVVGTPRSGTTLTAKVLGRHSQLFMPGETHYFDDIYASSESLDCPLGPAVLAHISRQLYTIYGRYYEPDDQVRVESLFLSPDVLADELSGCDGHAAILDRFMCLQMTSEGKHRWGNNAPRDLFSIAVIKSLFPDAKFVVCVRDIRGFLLSYQGKWKVTGDDHVGRLKKLYHTVVTSFLWKSSMR